MISNYTLIGEVAGWGLGKVVGVCPIGTKIVPFSKIAGDPAENASNPKFSRGFLQWLNLDLF